jgi:hypothetical protein
VKPLTLGRGVVTGGLALAVGLCGQASAGGGKPLPGYPAPADFSDRQLNPSTNPPAAVGNDLLLAEDAGEVTGTNGQIYPESWTTILNMTNTYTSGNVMPGVTKSGIFSGTGPTGTYAAGTIGDGKHTEGTLADIHQYYTAGSGDIINYQYVVTDTTYGTNGSSHTTTIYLPVYSYTS